MATSAVDVLSSLSKDTQMRMNTYRQRKHKKSVVFFWNGRERERKKSRRDNIRLEKIKKARRWSTVTAAFSCTERGVLF